MKQKAFSIIFKGLLLKQIKTKFEISSLVDQKLSGGSKTVDQKLTCSDKEKSYIKE